MKVSSVTEMRAMDRAAIEQFGIPEELLMENAGLAAVSVLREQVGISGKRFVVFSGLGNNGGDGFVVARKIHSEGGRVRVFVLGAPDKFRGVARLNLEILRRLPVDLVQLESADQVRTEISHCDAIVDAIFGTGLARNVEGLYREVISLICNSRKKILSLDIPSGIHGDTGKPLGVSVQADFTVTFGLPKRGNLLMPGGERGGRLYVTHISFPPSLYDDPAIRVAVNRPPALPPRAVDGHKGTFGNVLFVAGAATYYGAPSFSARAFMKAGGGYGRLAAPGSMIPVLAAMGSELVFVPQKETRARSLALANQKALVSLAEKVDMVVAGPGISLEAETQTLVRQLAAEIDKPLLIDGDGITAVAADLKTIRARTGPTVLTPHLGEMARLTGCSVSEIDEDKIGVLQRTAKDLGAIIVLKGAPSLIGTPDQMVFINTSGNPGMATAGSGDVLTGAIAAMFGLGLPPVHAVQKGVFLHGFAGDLAARDKGEDGVTARDILDYLPLALKMDRASEADAFDPRYAGPTVI